MHPCVRRRTCIVFGHLGGTFTPLNASGGSADGKITEVASQWPAVIGTLSGTSLGVASTWLLEGVRSKRQRIEKWDSEKRLTFVELLMTLDDLMETSSDWRELDGDVAELRQVVASSTERPTFERDLEAIEVEAKALRTRTHEGVRKLRAASFHLDSFVSEPVLALTGSLVEAVNKLYLVTFDGVPDAEWRAASDDVSNARSALFQAIRTEIGVR